MTLSDIPLKLLKYYCKYGDLCFQSKQNS